jgi:pilus assembly protein CpaB
MIVLRLAIFLLAAGAAGMAAWLSMQGEPQPLPQLAAAPEKVPTTDVLVASGNIASGSVLAPENVRWEPWPQPNLNESFITRDKRPDAMSELSGTFVNTPFVAGEPIREARLAATNVNLLSNKLASGKRAVAVKVTAESTAGGFILPGDRVDVIRTATRNGADGAARSDSQIIITNARVLAVDQTASQSAEGTALGKTATLELTPTEAEEIISAEASGMLSLALRAVADHYQSETALLDRVRTVRIHRAAETSIVTVE